MYMFGGSNPQPPDGGGLTDYNSVFKLHLETMQWTELNTTGVRPTPEARFPRQ